MPSVETLALTNAIRHAADMRSSEYHSPSSYNNKGSEFPRLYYCPKSANKFVSESEFVKIFRSNNDIVYNLAWHKIRKGVVVPPGLILTKHKLYVNGYFDGIELCDYGHKHTGAFLLDKNIPQCGFDYWSEGIELMDGCSIDTGGGIISTSLDSIKKFIDEIFSCKNWENANSELKNVQYDLLIRRIKEL